MNCPLAQKSICLQCMCPTLNRCWLMHRPCDNLNHWFSLYSKSMSNEPSWFSRWVAISGFRSGEYQWWVKMNAGLQDRLCLLNLNWPLLLNWCIWGISEIFWLGFCLSDAELLPEQTLNVEQPAGKMQDIRLEQNGPWALSKLLSASHPALL